MKIIVYGVKKWKIKKTFSSANSLMRGDLTEAPVNQWDFYSVSAVGKRIGP